jgi:hypothetical protein
MVAVPFSNTAGVDDVVPLNVHRVHSQALFRVRAETDPTLVNRPSPGG